MLLVTTHISSGLSLRLPSDYSFAPCLIFLRYVLVSFYRNRFRINRNDKMENLEWIQGGRSEQVSVMDKI